MEQENKKHARSLEDLFLMKDDSQDDQDMAPDQDTAPIITIPRPIQEDTEEEEKKEEEAESKPEIPLASQEEDTSNQPETPLTSQEEDTSSPPETPSASQEEDTSKLSFLLQQLLSESGKEKLQAEAKIGLPSKKAKKERTQVEEVAEESPKPASEESSPWEERPIGEAIQLKLDQPGEDTDQTDATRLNPMPKIQILAREDLEALEEEEGLEAAPKAAKASKKESKKSAKASQKEAQGKKPRSKVMEILIEWVFPIAFAFVFAFAIKNYVGGISAVHGRSMEPSLHEGDMLLVSKIPTHFKKYSRGDILIIDSPDQVEFYVKRLIGLPGERVEIKDGKVFINGKWLKDTWTDKETAIYNMDSWELGENEYFVLGDNREEGASNDSRVFGPILVDHIRGVAKFRLWPLGQIKAF